ncbi:hypothetical protein CR513_08438, partial [Mucuna pruriens]
METKKIWMDLFLEYFKRDVVPNDATHARKLMREASKYILVGEHLYKRGFSFPLLKCLDIDKAKYVMQEVHEDVCGSHIEGQVLASKVAKAGYYWPTLKHDCLEYHPQLNDQAEVASKVILRGMRDDLRRLKEDGYKSSLRTTNSNKLTPNWEGPYRIVEDIGKGAYRLEHLDEKKIPRIVANLQFYYS